MTPNWSKMVGNFVKWSKIILMDHNYWFRENREKFSIGHGNIFMLSIFIIYKLLTLEMGLASLKKKDATTMLERPWSDLFYSIKRTEFAQKSKRQRFSMRSLFKINDSLDPILANIIRPNWLLLLIYGWLLEMVFQSSLQKR